MKLTVSKQANINYLAKIVELTTFHNHPNPEVTKLKCVHVDGYNILLVLTLNPVNMYISQPALKSIQTYLDLLISTVMDHSMPIQIRLECLKIMVGLKRLN